jgi:hypothetical protein
LEAILQKHFVPGLLGYSYFRSQLHSPKPKTT